MPPDSTCYHCGLEIPGGANFPVEIEGVVRPMCCGGCQAVAGAIVAAGLDDYYRHRDALPESPREALPQSLADLGLFDHPEVQKSFVRPVGEHEREAALMLEGITCAACVWLNEAHLARQPGITAVDINYATRRARVRWDPRRINLSRILAAVAEIGYRAHPYDASRAEELARSERRTALWRVFVAGFGMMQVMMYAVPAYLAEAGSMPADIESLMRWASLVLTLPVVLYSAAPFFRNAWRDLRLRRAGMDVPVALGVGAAFLASVRATLAGDGEVYFDSVTMFVFFLLGGRYLEMLARHRAARGIEALDRALPVFAARLMRYPGLESERVAVAELRSGDCLLVKPGEVVPADGVVVDGHSAADESLLTGESRAVPKQPGSELIGGSLNTGSPLVMRVTRTGEQTRLSAIRRLVDQAAHEKPHLVELADRVAGHFVFAILALAAVAAIAWLAVEPARALPVAVAVLVVSCPCALSLATPAALTVATGALAGRGVLVARAHAIEALARADCYVFDKTGTLTLGRIALVETHAMGRCDEVLARRLAAALERGSEHPLARAFMEGIDASALPIVMDLRSQPGAGLEGVIDGRSLRLGSLAFAAGETDRSLPVLVESWRRAGDGVVALADGAGWLAFFRLTDQVRVGAASLVGALRRENREVLMLSGDSTETARRIAMEIGIGRYEGGLSPEDKHDRMRTLQAQGRVVAMIGDGVNDAPVLAQAQVSVAMGSGADLTRLRADVVLLGDDLQQLAAGIDIARRAMRIMRENLAWAFGYNLLAIPLAMAGWVTPWMAGIGMSASSLLVVLNALRLNRVSRG